MHFHAALLAHVKGLVQINMLRLYCFGHNAKNANVAVGLRESIYAYIRDGLFSLC